MLSLCRHTFCSALQRRANHLAVLRRVGSVREFGVSLSQAKCLHQCTLVRPHRLLRPRRMCNSTHSTMACSLTVDKDAFGQTLSLKALKIPAKQCQSLMKAFTGFTLNKPRTKCIVPDGDSKSTRLLVLSKGVAGIADFTVDLQQLISKEQLTLQDYELNIGYDQMSAEEVIREIVPRHVKEVTHAFETIGHIAHLNLRDDLLPYRHLIGQVLLDKNPAIKTVVNKVGNIDNEFRVFQMEVMAGEPKLETEVRQHSARFRLDYSQVYWNSRLETEHKRLVDSFKPGQVVADIMAGIGPFAVPAAQRGCKVLANDLNPNSYKYLQQNIQLNKVQSKVEAYNMDGRGFVRHLCSPQPVVPAASEAQQSGETSEAASPPGCTVFDHAIMNLPATAIEFLDSFHGAFDRDLWAGKLPQVHCYCFQRKDESHTDVQQRVEAALGGLLDSKLNIHDVRLVAPNKKMLCLTFHVPEAVAFAAQPKHSTSKRPDAGSDDVAKCSELSTTDQQVKRQRTAS